MKIAFDKASAAQLSEFASTNYGLDIKTGMSADKVRTLLATAGFRGDEIEVPDAIPAPVKKLAVTGNDTRRIKILIPHEDRPGGSDDVYTRVNGIALTIKRGEQSEIPMRFFEALQKAVQVIRDPNPDPFAKEPFLAPRQAPLYPVQVLGFAD
jgi:hypothetical protein